MKPSDFESSHASHGSSPVKPESSIRSHAIGAKPWLGLAHGGLVVTRKSTIRERVSTLRLGLYWHRLRAARPHCSRPHNLDHVQWRQPEAAVCGAIIVQELRSFLNWKAFKKCLLRKKRVAQELQVQRVVLDIVPVTQEDMLDGVQARRASMLGHISA